MTDVKDTPVAPVCLTEKTCTRCGETKPVAEFSKASRAKDGLKEWDKNGNIKYQLEYLSYVTEEFKKRKDAPKEKNGADKLVAEIVALQKKLVDAKIDSYDVASRRQNSIKTHLQVSKIADCKDEKLLTEYRDHLTAMLPENANLED